MIHEFKIGGLTCWAINESQRLADLEMAKGLFPSVPEDELRAGFESLSPEDSMFCVSPLFIQSLGLLIDTGNGAAASAETRLINQLSAAGVTPESIQTIFITHAHGDHINGLVTEAGDLAFPKASYVMGKTEWEFWMSSQPDMPAEYLAHTQGVLGKIADSVRLIESDGEIVAGVKAVEAFGHTVGHLAVEIQSEGETWLHIVDAFHTVIQVENPYWIPRFDRNPELAKQTRRQLIQRAAEENLNVYTYHLPYPALGKIINTGDHYQWQFERT